jgi:hypothetical protein
VLFFMSAICVWFSALPHRPQAEQRIVKFSVVLTHRSDSHSQCFHSLLRGQIEWFGGGRNSLTPVGMEYHNIKMFWVESFKCRIVWVKVSQCLNRGVPNRQGIHNPWNGAGCGWVYLTKN